MNRLMRADLKRIAGKRGLYVVVSLIFIYLFFNGTKDTSGEQIEFYKSTFSNFGLLFISIPIFLSVYTDEIKSGIMISVIGMGMERKKIVWTKLKDAFVLYCAAYLVLYYDARLINYLAELPVSPKQNAYFLLFCFFCVIKGVGVMALASLVLFLTMSSVGGMLVLFFAGAFGGAVLRAVQSSTGFPVYDFSFLGLLDSSFVDFQNGGFGLGLIPALIYLAAVIAVNIITFDRREMDL